MLRLPSIADSVLVCVRVLFPKYGSANASVAYTVIPDVEAADLDGAEPCPPMMLAVGVTVVRVVTLSLAADCTATVVCGAAEVAFCVVFRLAAALLGIPVGWLGKVVPRVVILASLPGLGDTLVSLPSIAGSVLVCMRVLFEESGPANSSVVATATPRVEAAGADAAAPGGVTVVRRVELSAAMICTASVLLDVRVLVVKVVLALSSMVTGNSPGNLGSAVTDVAGLAIPVVVLVFVLATSTSAGRVRGPVVVVEPAKPPSPSTAPGVVNGLVVLRDGFQAAVAGMVYVVVRTMAVVIDALLEGALVLPDVNVRELATIFVVEAVAAASCETTVAFDVDTVVERSGTCVVLHVVVAVVLAIAVEVGGAVYPMICSKVVGGIVHSVLVIVECAALERELGRGAYWEVVPMVVVVFASVNVALSCSTSSPPMLTSGSVAVAEL